MRNIFITRRFLVPLTVFCLAGFSMRAGAALPSCSVNWTNTQQHIDGFGFSSAWCGQLSSAKNNALYNTLGMSLLRVRIDPTQSWSQETSNAAAAHAYGVKVLGSEWSPPASMKSNGSTIGGSLLPAQYAAYANWLNLAANSIGLDYVSFQNEPDITVNYESCSWTPTEILNFVKTNAPAIGKPVVMPESYHFNDAYSDPVINDPVAVNNFAILAGHFYGGGNYVHTNALAHGKPVWMTEHYLPDSTTNFAVCLNWANEINTAMNNQFSAYFAWWVQDGDTNIDLADSSGHIYKDGYTMGQFAKFIRPGYYRIGTTSAGSGAQISAYKDPVSGNFVIVALNLGSTVITQQFNLNGFPASLPVTPWITSYTQSLDAQTSITNIGSAFTYSLQPSNIVTFVGAPLPSPPTGLTAAPGVNKVDLNWNAVTGASGYLVKRATVSGGPYTQIAITSATNYSDIGLPEQTTYYYVVSAYKDGGQSLNNPEVSATTPTISTMAPLADSYVESGNNANVNYGTSTNLWVKNNTTLATRITYLMFDVHALANVESATVTLMPSRVDDSSVPMYYELASTNWTENGITWNNQPGGTGVFLTTNTVSVGVPVVIDVTSAAARQATNGGLLSIRIEQPANTLNGLIQFCSKECPNASLRPVLTYALPGNTPPVLAPIADQTTGAGVTLNITNVATDSDVPRQTLTFSLPTAPTNATINASSGVLTWRPLVTQANTTNQFTVQVADNGTPSMSATQSFVVTVTNLVQPQLSTASWSNGQLVLQVSGASGPDYQIQSSTNLVNWSAVFTTNSPPMPFVWTNNNTSLPMSFFRVLVGPPF